MPGTPASDTPWTVKVRQDLDRREIGTYRWQAVSKLQCLVDAVHVNMDFKFPSTSSQESASLTNAQKRATANSAAWS